MGEHVTPDRASAEPEQGDEVAGLDVVLPRARRRTGVDEVTDDYRREVAMQAIWIALREYDHQRRVARDLRMVHGGGPTVKRGTSRPALAQYLADAVLDALASISAEPEQADEVAGLDVDANGDPFDLDDDVIEIVTGERARFAPARDDTSGPLPGGNG